MRAFKVFTRAGCLPRGAAAAYFGCGAMLAGGIALQPQPRAAGHAGQAVKANPVSEVWSWGSSAFGELGHGREADEPVPRHIDALRGLDVVSVASSGSAVSAAALTRDGRVLTMGCGRDNRLGHGDSKLDANQDTPRPVDELPEPAVSVAMGGYHGAAVAASGRVYTWGRRALGHANARRGLPNLVEGLQGVHVVQVACGREHTVAVDTAGAAWVWGVGAQYATGTGAKADLARPVALPAAAFNGERVAAVACGRDHTLFLTTGGSVYSCGLDDMGQCGTGFAARFQRVPVLVRGLSGQGQAQGRRVVAVAAGEYHSVAVCEDGAVYTWGAGKEGQLGHGDRADTGQPRLLEAQLEGSVVAAAAGGAHTLLLTDTGALYAVGRGRSGQLGRGDALESIAAYRTEPVEVSRLSRGRAGTVCCIAAGRDASYAVTVTGSGAAAATARATTSVSAAVRQG
jgi:alpha-tubulin suppressor-like RCC1 family protein